MAKKKYNLDDIGFNENLDIPDFNFSEKPIKDDRHPIVKLGKATIKGTKEHILSGAAIEKLILKSLPKGFESAYDTVTNAKQSLKDLYNNTAKDIKPALQDIQRTTEKLLPKVEGKIPKGLAESLKKMAKTNNPDTLKEFSKAERHDVEIQMHIADIFKHSIQQSSAHQQRNEVRDQLKEGLEQVRHRDQIGQLDSIRNSLHQLTAYKTKIESNYQRKSLEIQFRHYFLATEALEEQKRFSVEAKTALDAITKNTGLPDFVKSRSSEYFKEVTRNRFLGTIERSLFNKRTGLVKDIGSAINEAIKHKVSNTTSNIRAGLSQGDMVGDNLSMMKEMGVSHYDLAGDVAGGGIAGWLMGKVAKYGKSKLEKNTRIAKAGNKVAFTMENIPQILNEWAQKNHYASNSKVDKILPYWATSFGRDVINRLGKEDAGVHKDKFDNLSSSGAMNRHTGKTINEIIPGYLARIHRELKIIRTGNSNAKLMEYDLTSNKFADKDTVTSNVFKSVINRNDKEYLGYSLGNLIDKVDPNKTLSAEQRKELSKHILSDNLKGGLGMAASKKRLTNPHTYNSPHAAAYANVFSNYLADDTTGAKELELSRTYSSQGGYIDVAKKKIQDLINLGYTDKLEEIGILSPGSDQINLDKIYAYFSGDDFKPEIKKKIFSGRSSKGMKRTNFTKIDNRTTTNSSSTNSSSNTNNYHSGIGGVDNETIIKAIESISTVRVTEQIAETLLRIEKQVSEGGFGMGGGVGGSSANVGNDRFGNLWGSAKTHATRGIGALHGLLQRGYSFMRPNVTGLAQRGFKAASGAADWLFSSAKNAKDQVKDIFVAGINSPKLEASKLKAGYYRDAVTKTILKSFDDLKNFKNDIIDISDKGNVALRVADFKNAFVKSETGSRFLQGLKAITEFGKNNLALAGLAVGGVYGAGLSMAYKLYQKYTDSPIDIYSKAGKLLLQASIMAEGGYKSVISELPVITPSQIKGPIKDYKDDVVISEAQLAEGLFDKNGHPIKTGFAKLASGAMHLLGGGIGLASKAFGTVKDKLSQGLDFAKGKLGGGSGGDGGKTGGGFGFSFGGFSSSSTTNKILLQIRNMLNKRLSGEPEVFDDSETKKSTITKLMDKGNQAKSFFKNKIDQAKAGMRTLFSKFTSLNAMDRIGGMLAAGRDKSLDAMGFLSQQALSMGNAVGGGAKWLYDKSAGGLASLRDFTLQQVTKEKKENRIKNGIMAAMGLGKKALMGVGGALKKAGSTAASYMRNLFGKDTKGLYSKGDTKQEQLLEEVVHELHHDKAHIVGDVHGDGVRENSYADLLKKHAKSAGSAIASGVGKVAGKIGDAFGKKGTHGPSLYGMAIGGAKALWNKVRGKGAYGAEDDGTVQTKVLVEIRDILNERLPPDGFMGTGIDLPGGKNSRVAGKAGRFGKLGKVAGSLAGGAGKLLGVAGAGLGAYSAYQNVKEGNYGSAAVDVGLTGLSLYGAGASLAGIAGLGGAAATAGGAVLGAGSAVLGGLGTAAAAIGGLISAPVVLGALAIAAVAAGGYFAYKYFTKKKLTTLSTLRYAQYGFSPNDKDHLQAVFGLEDLLADAVTFVGGKPKLDGKKVDVKKILDSFGISQSDQKKLHSFGNWFEYRFKPVYLTHLMALYGIDPTKKLADIEKLEVYQKRKYFDIARFPDGPYSSIQSPFSDLPILPMDSIAVKAMITTTDAELKKLESQTKKEAPTNQEIASIVTSAGKVKDGDKSSTPDSTKKPEESGLGKLLRTAAKGGLFGALGIIGEKFISSNATNISSLMSSFKNLITSPPVLGSLATAISAPLGILVNLGALLFSSKKKLTPLATMRFIQYGFLPEQDKSKIEPVFELEDMLMPAVSIQAGKVTLTDKDIDLSRMIKNFGIDITDRQQITKWADWFQNRFKPVFLTHLMALNQTTGKIKLDDVDSLKAEDKRKYFNAAKFPDGPYAELTSPFSDISQLAASKKHVDIVVNVTDNLLQKAEGNKSNAGKDNLYRQDPDTVKKQMEVVKTTPSTSTTSSPSNSSTAGANTVASSTPSVTATASTLYNAPKTDQAQPTSVSSPNAAQQATKPTGNAISEFMPQGNNPGADGRNTFSQSGVPITGTGGKIDKVPLPTGNKSWNAMKDTITTASNMVGVDPKLMASVAAIESGFDTNVKAGTSTATGLYQFIRGTWQTMLKKYGAKYGISMDTPLTDARASALMGAEFMKENIAAIKGSVKGREISDTDVYLAHFLGAGGARKFLAADPSGIAAQTMKAEAGANKSLFFGKDGAPLTFAQVYSLIANRLHSRGKQFGLMSGASVELTAGKGNAGTTNSSAGGGGTPSVFNAGKDSAAANTASTTGGSAGSFNAAKDSSAANVGSSATPSSAKTTSTGNSDISLPVANATPTVTANTNRPSVPAPSAASAVPVDSNVSTISDTKNLMSQRSYQNQTSDTSMAQVSGILEKSYQTQVMMLQALTAMAGTMGQQKPGQSDSSATNQQSSASADKQMNNVIEQKINSVLGKKDKPAGRALLSMQKPVF